MKLSYFKTSLIGAISLSVPMTFSLVAPAGATPSARVESVSCSTVGVSEASTPVQLTYEEIAIAEQMIADGTIDEELVAALQGVHVDYELVGPAPRALPAVAAAAVAVVAWCAKGALSSVPASTLQDIASRAKNNIPPPDYVMNAIFGCAGGPVIGALTTQTMRIKFAGAVVGMIMKIRR